MTRRPLLDPALTFLLSVLGAAAGAAWLAVKIVDGINWVLP